MLFVPRVLVRFLDHLRRLAAAREKRPRRLREVDRGLHFLDRLDPVASLRHVELDAHRDLLRFAAKRGFEVPRTIDEINEAEWRVKNGYESLVARAQADKQPKYGMTARDDDSPVMYRATVARVTREAIEASDVFRNFRRLVARQLGSAKVATKYTCFI